MASMVKRALLILFSFLIVAVLGLYLSRAVLLESLLARELNKYGLPLQALTVQEFSFDALRLHDVKVGPHSELSIEKISVVWQISELLAGQPIAIDIDGLHGMLDLRKEFAFFPPSMTSGSGDIRLPWLPVMSLKNSTVHVRSAAGDMAVALSGHITPPQQLGNQVFHAGIMTDGPLGRGNVELNGTVTPQGNMQARIAARQGKLDTPGAQISHFSGEAAFALEAFKLQNLHTDLVLRELRIAGAASQAKPDSRISSEIAAIDQVTLKGRLHGHNRWTGELHVNVENGQWHATSFDIGRLSISVPVRIENLQEGQWRFGLRDPAQMVVGKMDLGEQANVQKPVVFSLSRADLTLTSMPQNWMLDHAVEVSATDLSLSVKRAGSAPVEAHLQPGKIKLKGQLTANKNYRGEWTLSDASFLLPQSHLRLTAISADAQLGNASSEDIVRFTIGQVQHQGPQPFFKPISVSGNLERQLVNDKPMQYLLHMTAGVPSLRYLQLTAQHAPESGNGILAIRLKPLRFSPEGLQPRALFPLLDAVGEVNGSVSANARIEWSKQGVNHSHGELKVHDISFVHEAAAVTDLNAMLNLDDLIALSSPPGQRITVRSIDPGVPVENLHISYQVQSAGSPRIALEKMHFSLMDGAVSLAPTVINPASARSELLIHVDHINLADFFDVINVKGLTGSGHLSGEIPLALDKNRVFIMNGHLAATAPGILRFQSEKAEQLLAGAGEEMNLLLQALQAFHYSELSVNLDKSEAQDLIAKLSLLGNNPDVKDGQPFQLNIKLETDIDKILDTINQGYNLSHEILRGSFRLN